MKDNPSIFKDHFLMRKDPSIFTSIAPKQSLLSIDINKPLQAAIYNVPQVRFKPFSKILLTTEVRFKPFSKILLTTVAFGLKPIFLKTRTTDETSYKSKKQDYLTHILESQANIYKS